MDPRSAFKFGFVALLASASARAQIKLSVYTDGSFGSGDIYGVFSTVDQSNMSGCVHSGYQTCGGIDYQTANGTTTCTSGEALDLQQSDSGAYGTWVIVGTAQANCSCSGAFAGGGPQYTIDVTGITALQDQAGNVYTTPFEPAVDTPQNTHWLNVYGNGFTDNGASGTPGTSLDSNPLGSGWAVSGGFHLGPPSFVSETEMQYPYYVDATATVTSHSITITTPVDSASASFSVGDATPVISSLAPSSIPAQVPTAVTISGSHFGTSSCPTLTFSESATYTASNCSDQQLTATITLNQAGGETVSVNAAGYGGLGFQPGAGQSQTSSAATITGVQVQMKLAIAGATTIDVPNNYSEDTTISVTAVRADTGATVAFPFPVYIGEDATTIYSQNGGTLPSPVQLSSSGTATFVAKSLAGPNQAGNGPPLDAQLKSTNFPVYGGHDLLVPQWVSTSQVTDPKAMTPNTPDWFKLRSVNLFNSPAPGTGPVLATISGYTLSSAPSCGSNPDPLAGACTPPAHVANSPVVYNPYANSVRLNTPASTGQTCGQPRNHEFVDTFYHESRHAYQFSLSVSSTNDADRDYLVNSIPIAPTNIFLDTTAQRTVCIPGTQLLTIGYSGDTTPDPWTVVLYALEEDACTYAGLIN